MINLIMTTRQAESNYIKRFISSLNEQKEEIRQQIRLIAVIQQPEELAVSPEVAEYTALHIEPCSLSRARNIGIDALPDEPGIVAFPDDDCWYNATVIDNAVKFLNTGECDFVSMGIFDPIKKKGFGNHRTLNEICVLNERNTLLKPISVCIFYRYDGKAEVPRFDERLGVGTAWGSGEETDFLLTLLHMGKMGIYNSTDTVYHETEREKDYNVASTYKYSVGFAVMAVKALRERGQKDAYSQFLKIKRRSLYAIFYYLFKPKRRAVYQARIKGYNRGIKEGKANFVRRKAKND